MTYDAVLPFAKSDRNPRPDYSSGYGGMTDTYGATAAAEDKDGKRKLGWLAKVGLGHGKGKGRADAAAAAAAEGTAGRSGSNKQRRADATAAAKTYKQQQQQLSYSSASGKQLTDIAAAAAMKRSAGGALFGRWHKQPRTAPAAAAAADKPADTTAGAGDDWPSMANAAAAVGAVQQHRCSGSSSRDVRAGADSDQLFTSAAAAPTAGYSEAAASKGGGKWRRLLGGRSAAKA
jgi:hypothetical protein